MALGPHAESEAEVLEHHELKGTVGTRIILTVVTPRGPVVDKTVDEVVAPGAEGEMGVLPGHVPFLTALKAGVLLLRDGSARSYHAVGKGFLEVGAGGVCRILVDDAQAPEDIDAAAVKAEEVELQEQLKKAAGDHGNAESSSLLLAKLAWAQARLAAVAASQKY